MWTLLRTTIGTFVLVVSAVPLTLEGTQATGTAEPLLQSRHRIRQKAAHRRSPMSSSAVASSIPFSRIVIVEGPTTSAEQRQCLAILRTRAEAQSSGDDLERLRRR